ncbi:cyclic nucleotide-binding domain-containing protein [Marivita sp. S6314]|uniref:Crp/Fnr family transcriptional regulator n=1 Tax=Marivita sp. S6314 TaxID=2926406 RepID=UPI001FF4AF5B|nr:cyclic nucleotide-binding domain-containing protein [Marivita sp. S6314]MCK0150525.1 cyclic nucleotide-binding domain-containing protein [Marivita sp. S6314]
MDLLTNLHWIEVVGWLASALTVASYSVSTMLPLRFLAITSSLCFATYAFTLQLWPLLAMELILLPINLYRFWQVLSLRGKLTKDSSRTETDFSVIRRYGKQQRYAAGATVFGQGDTVDQLYYVAEGRVQIEEPNIELNQGDIFGEIGFFTDAAIRTATVRCLDDTVVYGIDEKTFMRLQFEDPSFGLAIMRTITRRLIENVNRDAGSAAGTPAPA